MSSFIKSIRSEQLAILRQFIDQCSSLKSLIGTIFQIRLVIDTNAVLSDLLWIAKRDASENKPAIVEVIQAGTLIAYAPEQLKREVEKHLPIIADKQKLSLDKLQNEWLLYQEYLEFVHIDTEELVAYEDTADPEDAPFVVLSKMLGVSGVISDDPDIDKIGGKRIHVDIRLDLRDYSRSAAILYTLRAGGVLFSAVTIETIFAMTQGVVRLTKGLDNLPDKVKLFILASIILLFVVPDSRRYILERISILKNNSLEAWKFIGPIVNQLALEAKNANELANQNLNNIHDKVSVKDIKDA